MTYQSISVVIPTYNRVGTIRRCLDSVLSQSVQPAEVIVIDDCSTDQTVEVVRSYSSPIVRCVKLSANSGAQVARNRGILETTGTWIAFQDSDDEWLPDKLERQVAALGEAGDDPWIVVHGDALKQQAATGRRTPFRVPAVSGEDPYSQLLSAPGPLFPSLLVSRLALDRIGPLDERVPSYQEWDTSIRLAQHCRFVHIPEPLFVYHRLPAGTISDSHEADIAGYQYILDKFEGEIRGRCGSETWDRHMALQWRRCLDFGRWREADEYFAQMSTKNAKVRALQMCRRLHVPPRRLSRLKRLATTGYARAPD